MFRRLWTGLPDTPKFPADLEKLGYFVNEEDQIRNIKDPKYYFKYFIDRNMYYNDSQRFSFTAVQRIVFGRLATLGLRPVRLPLGVREDEPHLLVLATEDLATADRVLLFVGETAQDLGILAHRVVGGGGGIEQGSILSMVRQIRGPEAVAAAAAATSKTSVPAVLIANPSELFWWPDAHRSLSLPAVEGMPRPSAAHLAPRKFPGRNTIPGHETAEAHVASVFKELLARDDSNDNAPSPRITAIAIAGGADALETFLDDADHWQRWGPHMDSLVVLGGLYEEHRIKTDAFRAFLRQRGRAYIASEAPVDTPIAGPDGNSQAARATRFGCPVHSAGTSWLTELMFIEAQGSILAWGSMVAADRSYVNANIDITYAETILGQDDTTWANYNEEEHDGPSWGEASDKNMADVDEDKENVGVSGPAKGDGDGVSKDGMAVVSGTDGVEGGTVDAIKEKLAEVSLTDI
ncbi:hypothetical protein SCUCBS95973_007811 [Sporothrix curviconia]|uniref:Arb2 domain-containing protein n=1 Tax=Sporothrix curviconia TaxID=1260050 RepID=A0ABP0CGE0_9PEZI